ncbi:MAG: hypothetical protein ACRD2L_05605 [Terriglobia bacterium]
MGNIEDELTRAYLTEAALEVAVITIERLASLMSPVLKSGDLLPSAPVELSIPALGVRSNGRCLESD